MELDRAEFAVDQGGFLQAIKEKAQLIRDGYQAGSEGSRSIEAKGLLFAGMGFSGVVSALVKDACTRAIDTPFSIVKHYQIPHHVTPHWHCLAISYSGETEETLSVTKSAFERNVPITTFATGGSITAYGPNVPQPVGYQPRAAFGYTWFSVLGFLEGSKILNARIPINRCIEAVKGIDATCGPEIPEADNEAKQLARQLHEKIPQIYATPAFYGVGLHFRGMLNENAKKIADVDLVPECNHNDLTGWGDDPNRQYFTTLALSHTNQNPQITKRLEHMQERYTKWGVPWYHKQFAHVQSFEEHLVEQARAIQFLDYVSFYTAILRGVDPSEIREIQGLKEKLAD